MGRLGQQEGGLFSLHSVLPKAPLEVEQRHLCHTTSNCHSTHTPHLDCAVTSIYISPLLYHFLKLLTENDGFSIFSLQSLYFFHFLKFYSFSRMLNTSTQIPSLYRYLKKENYLILFKSDFFKKKKCTHNGNLHIMLF
uniref:Uncharacterized protein n=1 Tax=Sphaerodactylus townsendi TaxID=933632 RepID=A0ACB8FUX3_9SAUR